MKTNQKTIQIAPQTIIFALGLMLGGYLVYQLLDLVFLLFVAILFTAAVNPLVTKLERFGLSRSLSITTIFLLILVFIALLISLVLPPLASEITRLVGKITIPEQLISDLRLSTKSLAELQALSSQLPSLPKIFSFAGQAFNTIVILFTLFVISFYMLLEREHLHHHFTWLFGDNEAEKHAENLVNNFEESVGGWVRAELLLMLIVGIFTYIGLILLQVPFALPLAILAGILELLPNIGPTISAIPAIIIAYITVSPLMALLVLLLYIIIQQLENNAIVPYVMHHTVNIHPIITIILILAGLRLQGFVGAILAIPLYLAIKSLIIEYYRYKHGRQKFKGILK